MPEQRTTTYRDGNSYKNPVICDDFSEAFAVARERDRPVMVQVTEDGKTIIGKAFPSGRFEESP